MRTFTYSDAKSHKFWNIELNESSFTVTYGKIGSKGQSSTKSFATPEKAQKEADALIREKLSKGYVETTPPASRTPKQVLEEAILDAPYDPATYSAYADLLMEEGDPRGEFMQVQLRLEDPSLERAERKSLQAREQELLQTHGAAWLGALAPLFSGDRELPEWQLNNPRYRPAFRFEKGLLSELRFPTFGVAEVRALLQAAPETRLLHTLRLEETRYEEEGEFEPGDDIPEDADYDTLAVSMLARWKNLPNLRVFQLGEMEDEDSGNNCHTSGELAHHLVKQMTRVEELYLLAHRVDTAQLFALPLPRLRILRVDHSSEYALRKLAANASLTHLQQLLFHPHAVEDELPYEVEDFRAILESPHLQRLTHLRLRLSLMGDAAIETIVRTGALKRLKMLDLYGGTVTDRGAELIATHPDRGGLETLNLAGNELTSHGIRQLEAMQIKLDVRNQHGSTAGLSRDNLWEFEFLFDGDIE